MGIIDMSKLEATYTIIYFMQLLLQYPYPLGSYKNAL